MKKRILSVLLVAALAVGMLAGCGSSKSEESNTSAAAQEELKDFNVILDWYPNAIHSFMYVAQEKGYFAEQGLNVTLTAPASYSDGITFPAAGKAEVGLYYMNDATLGYAQEGMDIEVLGAVTQETLSCMIALKENNITRPSDFKGKKIGYTGGEALKQKLITCAKADGITEDDFELVDVGFDIETAITGKTVDACAGGMINNEVVELRNAGYEIDNWSLEDYGVPREYDILFIVNKTAYEADKDLYEGFLTACKKGFEDVRNDREGALDILFQHEDAKNYALDRTMETESLDVLIGVEDASGVEFTSMSKKVWEDAIAWMVDNGLLEKTVDPAEYVNYTLD